MGVSVFFFAFLFLSGDSRALVVCPGRPPTHACLSLHTAIAGVRTICFTCLLCAVWMSRVHARPVKLSLLGWRLFKTYTAPPPQMFIPTPQSRPFFQQHERSLILLGISFVMGRHFEALVKSGEIVGAGEDGDDSG